MEHEYAPNAMQDTDHIDSVKELETGMAMMVVLVLNWTVLNCFEVAQFVAT